MIFLGTGAHSYFDMDALALRGIGVHTISDYANRAVAEHAMALLWAASRQISRFNRELRAGLWQPRSVMQLDGKTLGLIGLGGIGLELARLARGAGLHVIAWNRTKREDAQVAFRPLDEVLEESDIVSLHLMLNTETWGFLNADRIGQLRHGALLINTARAQLVDQHAMLAALRSGAIGHAALDVFEHEPLAIDDPLLQLDNVTLTPHCAFRTPEASRILMRRALDIVASLQNDQGHTTGSS